MLWGLIFLIAVSCLLTRSNVAEAVYHETEVALGVGEALVTCPLTTDVSKTKHGIAITLEGDEVLLCSWIQDDKLVCDSSSGFELVGNLTNHVTAKALVARLQSDGLYECQLVPSLHEDDPSTACYVIKLNTDGQSAVEHQPPAPVPQEKNVPACDCGLDGPSAVDVPEGLPREHQTSAPDPPDKDVQNSNCKDGEYQGGLTAAVTAVIFIVVFHLLLEVAVVVFFYLWFKRGSGWPKKAFDQLAQTKGRLSLERFTPHPSEGHGLCATVSQQSDRNSNKPLLPPDNTSSLRSPDNDVSIHSLDNNRFLPTLG